jgi:predicted nucleotidyltransferase
MIQALKKEHGNILNLCKQYHVSRLELFGSAATSDFDSDKSDFDFLVEFHPLSLVNTPMHISVCLNLLKLFSIDQLIWL